MRNEFTNFYGILDFSSLHLRPQCCSMAVYITKHRERTVCCCLNIRYGYLASRSFFAIDGCPQIRNHSQVSDNCSASIRSIHVCPNGHLGYILCTTTQTKFFQSLTSTRFLRCLLQSSELFKLLHCTNKLSAFIFQTSHLSRSLSEGGTSKFLQSLAHDLCFLLHVILNLFYLDHLLSFNHSFDVVDFAGKISLDDLCHFLILAEEHQFLCQ